MGVPASDQPRPESKADGGSGRPSGRGLRRKFGKVEKNLLDMVNAVVTDGGNPFPPHLQDKTLTRLVITHNATPGARPADISEFEAAEGGGESVRGHTTVGDGCTPLSSPVACSDETAARRERTAAT